MTAHEGFVRYLVACRHDIAHLNGTSDQDASDWAVANLTEATTILNNALQTPPEWIDDGGITEHAFLEVKKWAQGPLFREL